MIKCTELMTGNILQYYIGEDVCEWQPTVIDWQDIKWCAEDCTNFNSVHKPIELTEEILLKCGFIFDSVMYEKDSICIADYKDGLFYAPSGILGDGRSVQIKWLHQLQNLIMALTGHPLEVNL